MRNSVKEFALSVHVKWVKSSIHCVFEEHENMCTVVLDKQLLIVGS